MLPASCLLRSKEDRSWAIAHCTACTRANKLEVDNCICHLWMRMCKNHTQSSGADNTHRLLHATLFCAIYKNKHTAKTTNRQTNKQNSIIFMLLCIIKYEKLELFSFLWFCEDFLSAWGVQFYWSLYFI